MKAKLIVLLVLILIFSSCDNKEGISDLDINTARYSADDLSETAETRRDGNVLFTKPAEISYILPDSKFSGNYTLSYIGDASGGYGIPFAEGSVNINPISGSTNRRSFNEYWAPEIGGFFVGDFIFDFISGKVVVEDFSTGLACSEGVITIIQGNPSTFNLGDDSEIILNIIEYHDDGGCDIEPIHKTIKLTKE